MLVEDRGNEYGDDDGRIIEATTENKNGVLTFDFDLSFFVFVLLLVLCCCGDQFLMMSFIFFVSPSSLPFFSLFLPLKHTPFLPNTTKKAPISRRRRILVALVCCKD